MTLARWLIGSLALLLSYSTVTLAVGGFHDDYGVEVINAQALTLRNTTALRSLLTAVPRPLWGYLTHLHVDDVGFSVGDQFAVNCLSGLDDPQEDPFPSDLPGVHPTTSVFYAICSHELSHQLPIAAGKDRPWLNEWASELIREAGCEPSHYLRRPDDMSLKHAFREWGPRGPFPPCFFMAFPQEFVASMSGQWLADSQAVWRLAVGRFKAGNPHPANQAVLLTVWFGGLARVFPPVQQDFAVTVGFRYVDGMVSLEVWQVHPWRCGGASTIAGRAFSLQVVTDAQCRVTEVLAAEGL